MAAAIVTAAIVTAGVLAGSGWLLRPAPAEPSAVVRGPELPTPPVVERDDRRGVKVIKRQGSCPTSDPPVYAVCLWPLSDGVLRNENGRRSISFAGQVGEVSEEIPDGCPTRLIVGNPDALRTWPVKDESRTTAAILMQSDSGGVLRLTLSWPEPLALPRVGEQVAVEWSQVDSFGLDPGWLEMTSDATRLTVVSGDQPPTVFGHELRAAGEVCRWRDDCASFIERDLELRAQSDWRRVPRYQTSSHDGLSVRVLAASELEAHLGACDDYWSGGYQLLAWRAAR